MSSFSSASSITEPFAIDDLDAVGLARRAAEREAALASAKAWCLRMEEFFERAARANVATISFASLQGIKFQLRHECGSLTTRLHACQFLANRHALLAFEKEFEALMRQFNECSKTMLEHLFVDNWGAYQASMTDHSPADAAGKLGALLMGPEQHRQWMSEREAMALSATAGIQPGAPSPPPRL